MKHRMMLDLRSDEMPAFVSQQTDSSENGEIITFRPAAGENDLARFAPENGSDPVAGVIKQRAGFLADVMDAGRVAPNFVKKRQHGGFDAGIERRGGVVI